MLAPPGRLRHPTLGSLGFPVATPLELRLGESDVHVSEYVVDDGHGADPLALGALLRRLHGLPLPVIEPVAAHRVTTPYLLVRRILERLERLAAYVTDLPAPPPAQRLTEVLASQPTGRLLHLDVRASNLRCVDGAILGVLDWSNSLVGDPAMELGRLAEYALLPDNGIEYQRVLDGYGDPVPMDSAAFWIYRLDAAVMLALLFSSEAPHMAAAPAAVNHVSEVRDELLRALAG